MDPACANENLRSNISLICLQSERKEVRHIIILKYDNDRDYVCLILEPNFKQQKF